MPRATRYTGSLHSHMPMIARRLRTRMHQLGINETELARLCNKLPPDLLSGSELLLMSRDRISKILMNCKRNPAMGAAKVISFQELQAFSHTLKVSLEWLAGQQDNSDPVIWNALSDPRRADHILHLLSEYEEKAGEITVWAEFLMCSLVTPEFMRAYHEAHFRELVSVGLYIDTNQ